MFHLATVVVVTLITGVSWAQEAPLVSPPRGIPAELMQLLPTQEELRVIRHPQRHDHATLDAAYTAACRRLLQQIPQSSLAELEFIRETLIQASAVSRKPFIPSERGITRMIGGTRERLRNELNRVWVVNARNVAEFTQRFVSVEPSLAEGLSEMLNVYTRTYPSFRARLAFAHELHKAGARGREFVAWAEEMNRAAAVEPESAPVHVIPPGPEDQGAVDILGE